MPASTALPLPRSVRASLWLPTVHDATTARRAARALVDEGDTHLLRLAAPVAPVEPTWVPPGLVDPAPAAEAVEHLPEPALADLLVGLSGAREHAAVLPRPGDPMGVPAARSGELLEAGEGLLVRGHGGDTERCAVLVPVEQVFGSVWEQGVQVTWSVDLDVPAPAPSLLLAGVSSLSHARREIQLALSDAVEALTDLDVARERPDLAEDLLDLSLATLPDHQLPPGLEPRRVDVLERAARLLAIVELATTDDGAAVTTLQAGRRSAVLRDVERAARHAMCAASARRAG